MSTLSSASFNTWAKPCMASSVFSAGSVPQLRDGSLLSESLIKHRSSYSNELRRRSGRLSSHRIASFLFVLLQQK
eukprot:1152498-Ditylum_brightwellii.AAC.1